MAAPDTRSGEAKGAARHGRFVTFEGIDGAGKSSHVDALAAWLRARGHEVVMTREPGGTPLAERVREIFLHESMDALTETLLVFAARRDHLQRVIVPAIERGATVLCDRFTDASFAYQGGGRGVATERLALLEDWVQQGREPDLTLWFDLPARVAAERRAAARSPDRLEGESLEFFERVRAAYEERARRHRRRIVRVAADGAMDAVRAQVLARVQEQGWW